jgi:hypothetical protein
MTDVGRKRRDALRRRNSFGRRAVMLSLRNRRLRRGEYRKAEWNCDSENRERNQSDNRERPEPMTQLGRPAAKQVRRNAGDGK